MPVITTEIKKFQLIHPFPMPKSGLVGITINFYTEEDWKHWLPILEYVEKCLKRIRGDDSVMGA